MDKKPFNYRNAGVDIEAGNRLVERIKPHLKRTHRPGVLGAIGGFGGLFELPLERYRQPVLVSGTDGVGTKLMLALQLQKFDTVGIDLVAMCVNDIIVCGAEPLFFLDYYATGKLDVEAATQVIAGIARGCELAGAALIGGETAEMPGLYQHDDFDLAGFCVGMVEKDQLIDGSLVTAGDVLIGLASSGLHSNGFSLVRKIIDSQQHDLQQTFVDTDITLGEALLTPTRIYVRALLSLLQQCEVHAIAHITGGGITENLPRVLPNNTQARIERGSWQGAELFNWLQNAGNIDDREMLKTFNCGIGMIVCVGQQQADKAIEVLNQAGESASIIGSIQAVDGPARVIYQ